MAAERGVGPPKVAIVLGVGEGAAQPLQRGTKINGPDQRQAPVDQHDVRRQVRIAVREADRDEATHRVSDHDDRPGAPGADHRGQVGRVRRHSPWPRQLSAPAPATQVRRDESPDWKLVGQQRSAGVVGGHAVHGQRDRAVRRPPTPRPPADRR